MVQETDLESVGEKLAGSTPVSGTKINPQGEDLS